MSFTSTSDVLKVSDTHAVVFSWMRFMDFIFIAWLEFTFIGCHMRAMTTASGHYKGEGWQLSVFWFPGLVFRGYANENRPVMVLINSSTTGPFKAVQELQKQETLIHDIINSSFFVFLISSSELFCFHPAPAVVFQHHPALCVMMCSSLFLRLVKIPLVFFFFALDDPKPNV